MGQPGFSDDPTQLFEHDDATELFREMDLAIRQGRYQAAVKPRRLLKREHGYSVLLFPTKRSVSPASSGLAP